MSLTTFLIIWSILGVLFFLSPLSGITKNNYTKQIPLAVLVSGPILWFTMISIILFFVIQLLIKDIKETKLYYKYLHYVEKNENISYLEWKRRFHPNELK